MYPRVMNRYVFTKKRRASGEQVDVSEDMNNFDVSIVDCGNEMEEEGNEEEEYVVESEESDEEDCIVESDENDDE